MDDQGKQNEFQVFLRFRPKTDLESSAPTRNCVQVRSDNTEVTFTSPDKVKFKFDRVFDEKSSQATVYNIVGAPLVEEFLSGRNCCLFTYGEKETGKTFTMLGTNDDDFVGDDISSLGSCGISEAQAKPSYHMPTYGNQYGNKNSPPLFLNVPQRNQNSKTMSEKKEYNSFNMQQHSSLQTPIQKMKNANMNHLSRWNTNVDANTNNDVHKTNPNHHPNREGHGAESTDNNSCATLDSGADLGIISRIVNAIFENLTASADVLVKFSMFAIYLDGIRDLLGSQDQRLHRAFAAREQDGHLVVDGITVVVCTTATQVMSLIERGCENLSSKRSKRYNGILNNEEDLIISRSHIVFELTAEQYDKKTGKETINSFHLFDLAGTEHDSGNSIMGNIMVSGRHKLIEDTKMFNESMDLLENMIPKTEKETKRKQENVRLKRIPAVVQILQHTLRKPKCRASIILTASPCSLHIGETMNTVRFGQRMRNVKVKKRGTFPNDENAINRYKLELEKSEKNREELSEKVKELELALQEKNNDPPSSSQPKRRVSRQQSMSSIIEVDDEETSGDSSQGKDNRLSPKNGKNINKKSNAPKEGDNVSNQNPDDSSRSTHDAENYLESSIAETRKELKIASSMLQSASEKMKNDLAVANEFFVSDQAILPEDTAKTVQDILSSSSNLTLTEIDNFLLESENALKAEIASQSQFSSEPGNPSHDEGAVHDKRMKETSIDKNFQEETLSSCRGGGHTFIEEGANLEEDFAKRFKEELNSLRKENEMLRKLNSQKNKEIETLKKNRNILSLRVKELEDLLEEKEKRKPHPGEHDSGNKLISNVANSNISNEYYPDNETSNGGPDKGNVPLLRAHDKESVRVYLRIRPMNVEEKKRKSKRCILVDEGDKQITVDSIVDGEFNFTFDKVINSNASQSDVHGIVGGSIVSSLLRGINYCTIALGPPGSGKTATLFGLHDLDGNTSIDGSDRSSRSGNFERKGLFPRIVKDMFARINDATSSREFTVRCSFVALYIEKIHDLLEPLATKNLYVREGAHGTEIIGACKAYCFDEKSVLSLVQRGRACFNILSERLKIVSNQTSLIFTVEIEQVDIRNQFKTLSRLQIVDMAGIGSTFPCSNVMVEKLQLTHKSASVLGSVIKNLSQGGTHAPYKDSTLTSVLKDAFGGNCRTSLIITASPSSIDVSKSLNAIRLGNQVLKVKNTPRVNFEFGVADYKRWLIQCEVKFGELADFVIELAHELLSVESLCKIASSSLWQSICAIVRDEIKMENPCRVALCCLDQNALQKYDLKWKALSFELSKRLPSLDTKYLCDDNDRMKSLLSDTQSELVILKRQNELLSKNSKADKTKYIKLKEKLDQCKFEKADFENELGLCELREKRMVTFLLHLRKICWRLQSDLTQTASRDLLSTLTSLPGTPDLSGLLDVDALLMDAGILKNRDFVDDVEDGAFFKEQQTIPQGSTRMSFTRRFSKSRQEDSLNEEEPSIPELGDLKLPRRSSMINLPSMSSKLKSSSALSSLIPASFFDENVQGETGQSDDVASILRQNTAIFCQTFLGSKKRGSLTSNDETISSAGANDLVEKELRSSTQREKELKNDLMATTRKYLDLQVKLQEEKSHVEALVNRNRTVLSKRAAQDMLDLRKENGKMINNVKATAWKLYEVQTVNIILKKNLDDDRLRDSLLEDGFKRSQEAYKKALSSSQENCAKLQEKLTKLEKVVDFLTMSRIKSTDLDRVVGKINAAMMGRYLQQQKSQWSRQLREPDDVFSTSTDDGKSLMVFSSPKLGRNKTVSSFVRRKVKYPRRGSRRLRGTASRRNKLRKAQSPHGHSAVIIK